MPYIGGATLAEHLASDGGLPLHQGLKVAQCVAEALDQDHKNGVLHCAVSPSNIVLNDEPRTQAATVIDLGLARNPSLVAALRPRFSSRALYIAPELAGLIERDIGPQSDLYSLGIVIFECLAGHPPFGAGGLRGLLRDHATSQPARLRDRGVAAPRALDELVSRLLKKDPADRYLSASDVLAELHSIESALDRGIFEPAAPRSEPLPRMVIGRPAFTGRAAELSALDRSLRDAQRGAGSLVVIEAESGGGKSRLVETFCARAASSGAWVLRGEGTDRTASRPLHVLSGVLEDITSAMRRDTGLTGRLRRHLGEGASLLVGFLPELEGMLDREAQHTFPPGFSNHDQVLRSFVNLIDGLGEARRPAVVLLEDCQWADEFTLQVLNEWLSPNRSARRHVIILATIRTEEFPEKHVLRNPSAICHRLSPLTSSQVTEMVRSMASDLPQQAVQGIAAQAQGNPLMVSTLVLGLIESGALTREGQGWKFHPEHVPLQASHELAAFLARRLELLPARTRHVLVVGAVIGRTFGMAQVIEMTGLSPEEVLQELQLAEDRHLIWSSDELCFTLGHDRLREALLGAVEPETAQELHLAAARSIAMDERASPFELAFHYDAGGDHIAAFEHACVAADISLARYDLDLAEHHLRIAERGTEENSPSSFTIAEQLGVILMLRGKYDAAEERLSRALSRAPSPVAAARCEGHLGELMFKRGDGLGAESHLVAALGQLGHLLPAPESRFELLFVRELLSRTLGDLPRRGSTRIADNEAGLLEARLLTRLAYTWWFNRPTFAALWILTRQVNVAERRSKGAERAHAEAIYGAALAAVFPVLSRRGLRHIEAARLRHIDVGNRWGEGQALGMRAAALHAAGKFREGLNAATAAIEILEQTGDRWELSFVTWHRALCLYRLGRVDEAIAQARLVQRWGIQLGAAQAEAIALEILAKAGGGLVTSESISDSLSHVGTDAHAKAAALQASACRLRASGRLDEAIGVLEQADIVAHPPAYMNVYLAPLISWLATLRREAAQSGHGASERYKAQASVRRALRWSLLYRTERPRALREAALVASLTDKQRRVRRLLRKSAEIAARQMASIELQETVQVAKGLGFSDCVADSLTKCDLKPLPPDSETRGQPTLALVERFEALLEAGSLLASAKSHREVADAIAEACRSLLLAEKCFVAGVDGSVLEPPHQIEGLFFPEGPEFVRRALDERRSTLFSKPPLDRVFRDDRYRERSVLSAICAPVTVRRDVVTWFLVANSQVNDFFNEEDARLADFVARLAGAALVRIRLQLDLQSAVIAAQEDERARIARDLHDELGQSLTSVLLGLRAVQTAACDPSVTGEQLSDRLEALRSEASTALAELHRLSFELRPLVLDDVGLVAALQRFLSEIQANHHITTELAAGDFEWRESLYPDIETTLYRVG